jgi:hypothetical protein
MVEWRSKGKPGMLPLRLEGGSLGQLKQLGGK